MQHATSKSFRNGPRRRHKMGGQTSGESPLQKPQPRHRIRPTQAHGKRKGGTALMPEPFDMKPATYVKALIYKDLGIFNEPLDRRKRRRSSKLEMEDWELHESWER